MNYVRELEVWGYPGNQISLEECDRLIASIANELSLPENTLIPYHSIPDVTDVENLSIGLSERELTLDDFVQFCTKKGIFANLADSNSANEFLTLWYGQKLAWLHLPQQLDTDLYLAKVYGKLKERHCSLIDPDSLVCLIH